MRLGHLDPDGRHQQGTRGKVTELWNQARSDLGRAADCLSAAFGRTSADQTEDEELEAYVGWMIVADGIHNIRLLRELWTPKKKK